MSSQARLSLGSNKGDKEKNLKRAIQFISQDIGEVVKLSSIYSTEPRYNKEQSTFFNMIVLVQTQFSPFTLLRQCLQIENKMGREQTEEKNTPRIIDIDIVFYDDLVIESKELTIPHQKLYERNFVLYPLNEIDPEFVDPQTEKSVTELLDQCTDESKVTAKGDFQLQELGIV